jgi:hypothetical protein
VNSLVKILRTGYFTDFHLSEGSWKEKSLLSHCKVRVSEMRSRAAGLLVTPRRNGSLPMCVLQMMGSIKAERFRNISSRFSLQFCLVHYLNATCSLKFTPLLCQLKPFTFSLRRQRSGGSWFKAGPGKWFSRP